MKQREFAHTVKEAEELLDSIDTQKPTHYPGMTYEQGVEEALRWLIDDEAKPEL